MTIEGFKILRAGTRQDPGAEHAAALKVTTGGRITIPKRLRDEMGLFGGDVLEFKEDADGSFLVTKSVK